MAGLDRQVCRGLLQSLVEAGFLEHHLRGAFVRSRSALPTNLPVRSVRSVRSVRPVSLVRLRTSHKGASS
jgi:hypothetical protein